jgi:hypothetical protein
MGIATIAQATNNDPTLQKVIALINKGQTWVSKAETAEVQRFRPILSQLTVTGNGIILKDDRIVLPATLQEKAIQIAHKGAHPGQEGLKRRLRYHFFFHGMDKKVEEFVRSCDDCNVFVDKKTKEPIKPHRIPDKCWDTVAVDLFGPMPSSNHVVVVQDQTSRFPAAKLVASTKAGKVIPALKEIYDTYGNPDRQISDNGPPFNSGSMSNFASQRDITLQTTPPLHSSANPVETFMRPLGKAMKIGRQHGIPEKETLSTILQNYRQTPHPATGIPPAAMLFRHGQRLDFPRRTATEEQVTKGREMDLRKKRENETRVNDSKYRQKSTFKIDDNVLIRNYNKTRKFDTLFLQAPFKIIDMNEEGNKITVRQEETGLTLCRHPDDIKPCKDYSSHLEEKTESIEYPEVQWPTEVEDEEDDTSCSLRTKEDAAPPLRRSQRKKTNVPVYK